MFYSHEILTSRKHGIATVWLVATIGSKSHLKKINRKAILDVNIPKACHTVTEPEAPMALRLQSNLLYGISRVYSQQCGYILSDAQLAQSHMTALLKAVRTVELDPNAGKARPDQLILHDDPAFAPENLFPLFDLEFAMLEDSSNIPTSLESEGTKPTSLSSEAGRRQAAGVDLPSASEGAGDYGGFDLPESLASSVLRQGAHVPPPEDEPSFLPDVGFTFDEDGNIVETGEQRVQGVEGKFPVRQQVNRELRAATAGDQEEVQLPEQMDLDAPLLLDDAEPFTVGQAALPAPEQPAEEPSSEHAAAPQARRRALRGRRVLPIDTNTQIPNATLGEWNRNYLANMADARQHRAQARAPALARRNAYFFVYGHGLGGPGPLNPAFTRPTHPLATFVGAQLEALIAVAAGRRGPKRSLSPASRSESEGERRTRPRTEEGVPHPHPPAAEDEGILAPLDDNTMEMGRDKPPSLLDDRSSAMPWNIPSSVPGSAHFPSRIGSHVGLSAQQQLPAGLPTGARPFDRRASRLVSASPLHGRGPARALSIQLPSPGGLPAPEDFGGGGDDEGLLGPLQGSTSVGPGVAADEFELFGPAAAVTTQTAADSQWQRVALGRESNNFLDFVRANAVVLEEGAGEGEEGAEGAAGTATVRFSELLPPERHTRVVAAQGFQHVLMLATRGLLRAWQDEGGEWGDVWLGVDPTIEQPAAAAAAA